MPKRKREDEDDEYGEDEVAFKPAGIKQQRVAYKLQQGARKVAAAFKLAKGFERQKLSRRRKTATSQQKAEDVQRIDAEIVALKALDHAAAARNFLFKSLLKIKAVSEHPDLPEGVKKAPAKGTDAPTLNVVARLCKSNQAREALQPAIADVQNALGLEKSKNGKKPRLRAKDYEKEAKGEAAGKKTKPAPIQKHQPEQEHALAEAEDFSDDDADGGVRLAVSDDEDAPSDMGLDSDQSIGEIERQLEAEGVRQKGGERTTNGYNHEADLSISESESNLASPSPEPQKAGSTPAKRSAFLPTLTMGGYISGSGSEAEDAIDVLPKKNRRGQRARQQIWEKKFGKQAKHLQGQPVKEKDSRKAGWDPKRGATDGSEGFGKARYVGGPRGKTGGGGGGGGKEARIGGPPGAGEPPKKKHRDDGGAIHPSWEAAKKAKERKEAPAAFQGKKITFD